jgi:hypothetical protein
MSWMKKIVVVAVAAAYACSAQTTVSKSGVRTELWAPPKIDWQEKDFPPTIPQEMIGTLLVANLPIFLESTTLEDVHKRLGGTIGVSGDPAKSDSWLCFVGKDTGGSWIFWLTSHAAQGPAIAGFQWRRMAANETPDRRCRLLKESDGGIELPIGLYPGMSEGEARKVLGDPSLIQGETLVFECRHQETRNDVSHTLDNTIAIVIHDGMVVAIQVSKATSS